MNRHTGVPAAGSCALETGAVELEAAHYFLYRLFFRAAGKLYKRNHFAET
jgi:hypothetical protein